MICPSPIILDHSFPSSQEVLDDVVGALGNMQECRDMGEIVFVASPIFPDFIASINWQKATDFPQLRDVHRYLTMLFLQPNTTLFLIDTDSLPEAPPHPLPDGCPISDATGLWAIEVGKLKHLHDERGGQHHPFIGVGCHKGFAGKSTGTYQEMDRPHLPIVGLADLSTLADSVEIEVDPNLQNQSVSFRDAKRNIRLLGGEITNPSGSSHYTVRFPGAPRPWVLDANIDPVSEDYLRQIAPLIKESQAYVRHVLINGSLPSQRFKLQ